MYKKAILHFKRVDPVLYSACLKINSPITLSASATQFFDLCKSIIYQQLSVKAGKTILERFMDLFPKKQISPENLLNIKDEKVRTAGISSQKIKYLKDLAQKIINSEIVFKKLRDENEEIIIEKLTKVKGIGQWTAEMFLMFSLGRPDVFSGGDLGLRNAIQKIYNLKNRPSIKEAEKIAEKWTPYRTFASIILWRSNKS